MIEIARTMERLRVRSRACRSRRAMPTRSIGVTSVSISSSRSASFRIFTRRQRRFNVSDEERRRLADAESRPAEEPDDDHLDVHRGAPEDGVVLVPAEPVDRLLKATWEA